MIGPDYELETADRVALYFAAAVAAALLLAVLVAGARTNLDPDRITRPTPTTQETR